MKVGDGMNAFLLNVLVISLIVMTLLTFYGFNSKSNENLILFQSLPVTFILGLLYAAIPLQRYLFPGEDTDGYGFGFTVLLPTGSFMFFSMLILGIKGLSQWKVENDMFLLVTSLASSLLAISIVYLYFLFPLLTLYILGLKTVRKLKGKFDSHST